MKRHREMRNIRNNIPARMAADISTARGILNHSAISIRNLPRQNRNKLASIMPGKIGHNLIHSQRFSVMKRTQLKGA